MSVAARILHFLRVMDDKRLRPSLRCTLAKAAHTYFTQQQARGTPSREVPAIDVLARWLPRHLIVEFPPPVDKRFDVVRNGLVVVSLIRHGYVGY